MKIEKVRYTEHTDIRLEKNWITIRSGFEINGRPVVRDDQISDHGCPLDD